MRVIARRHRRAAHGRANTQMALAAGFTQFDVAMIQVPNLPDGCVASLADQAHFSGRHADLSVVAFFGQQLGCSTGCAHQLAALPSFNSTL